MALRTDMLGPTVGSANAPDEMAMPSMDPDLAGSRVYTLLFRGPAHGKRASSLDELRRLVLTEGVPAEPDGTSKLRIYTWLVFLGAGALSTDAYVDLVRQGPSPAYDKIRLDTRRTLKTDALFQRRVTENNLVRVLNGMALRLNDAHEAEVNGWKSPPTMSVVGDLGSVVVDDPSPMSRSFGGTHGPSTGLHHWGREGLRSPSPSRSNTSRRGSTTTSSTPGHRPIGYVQGMNVLAAPFLYVARSEAQAFQGLYALLTNEIPAYILPSMEGVHRGVGLVDEILSVVDPVLAEHLHAHGASTNIWAFPNVVTLCACTPPLVEVLLLWDFLLAYGCHMNLLCIVAQVMLIRDQVLKSVKPSMLLRPLPALKAEKVIKMATTHVLPHVAGDLYDRVVLHAKP